MVWETIDITTESGETVRAQAPVIVSASRATDIPAFYADWFFDRLEKGYSVWTNPFNGAKSYVSYARTRLVVFWSKNPRPLLPHLEKLREKGIRCYLHYTLNDYETEGLERGIPPLDERIGTFLRLSELLGKELVIWRFDPLIRTDRIGVEEVTVVPEQEQPDGNFPTVAYPNPEDEKAWTLALKLAKEVDADIILATDPDADRLGVYAKDSKTGEYVSFTGNMSGMLIAEYILRERTKNGTMPENPALVETIVTTDMAKAIAKAYNVALIEVLTGFKYIGEQIKFFEQSGAHNYVFGLEESYGCLAGTYARDKDACVAVMMLCEVAAYYKQQGKTLWDAMVDMYEEYGYYKEGLATMTLKGIDGAKEIQTMMTNFRENPPKELGGFQVLAVRDYKADVRQDLVSGEKSATGLPSSNVLYYELENNAWCCVRPSGTEPKIKFYFGVKGTSLEDAAEKLEKLKNAMVTA